MKNRVGAIIKVLGLDVTSRLIGGSLSDHPSGLSKVQRGVLHVMGYSATRIPSLSITGHHPQPTGGLMGRGSYPSVGVQSVYSKAPADRAELRKKGKWCLFTKYVCP